MAIFLQTAFLFLLQLLTILCDEGYKVKFTEGLEPTINYNNTDHQKGKIHSPPGRDNRYNISTVVSVVFTNLPGIFWLHLEHIPLEPLANAQVCEPQNTIDYTIIGTTNASVTMGCVIKSWTGIFIGQPCIRIDLPAAMNKPGFTIEYKVLRCNNASDGIMLQTEDARNFKVKCEKNPELSRSTSIISCSGDEDTKCQPLQECAGGADTMSKVTTPSIRLTETSSTTLSETGSTTNHSLNSHHDMASTTSSQDGVATLAASIVVPVALLCAIVVVTFLLMKRKNHRKEHPSSGMALDDINPQPVSSAYASIGVSSAGVVDTRDATGRESSIPVAVIRNIEPRCEGDGDTSEDCQYSNTSAVTRSQMEEAAVYSSIIADRKKRTGDELVHMVDSTLYESHDPSAVT